MSSVFQKIQEQIDAQRSEVYSRIDTNHATTFLNFYNFVTRTFRWSTKTDLLYPIGLTMHHEESLCNWGRDCMTEIGGKLAVLPCYGSGKYRGDGQYETYTLIEKDGTTHERSLTDIEICYNNSMQIPSVWAIRDYTDKTSYALTAVNTQLERSILPDVYGCDNDEALSVITEMYKEGNKLMPFVVTKSSAFNKQSGGVTRTSPFDNREKDVLALWDVFIRYRNQFYTVFGASTVEIEKQERLTERESAGNDEICRYTLLQDMYNCREDWKDRCKKHFGIEMEIDIARDARTVHAIMSNSKQKYDFIEEGNISTTKTEEMDDPKEYHNKEDGEQQ